MPTDDAKDKAFFSASISACRTLQILKRRVTTVMYSILQPIDLVLMAIAGWMNDRQRLIDP